jgi:glycerol-3-phosphate cytidylyltransferase
MRVGIASAFDLLHAGHVLMLKELKELHTGAHIVAFLHRDPSTERPEKNKPVQSLEERFIQLNGCKYVDEIVVYETEKHLELLYKTMNIRKIGLGKEYQHRRFTGDKLFDSGYDVFWVDRDHGYSTSELRDRVAAQRELDKLRIGAKK